MLTFSLIELQCRVQWVHAPDLRYARISINVLPQQNRLAGYTTEPKMVANGGQSGRGWELCTSCSPRHALSLLAHALGHAMRFDIDVS